MLQADNISIRFRNECVLDRFSCHIERGAFACIVGTSGCGKTSLLKAFLGLAPLAEGSIRVGGKVLGEHTCCSIRRLVTYLPQDLALPYDTVIETVNQVLRGVGLRYDCSMSLRLCENLVRLGLETELLDKRLLEISGGQRQRFMLALLALLDREVWLLDEPTAALDADSRDYVIKFLAEQQRKGRTIVVVTHDPAFLPGCSAVIQMC